MEIIDLSQTIQNGMTIYPGDPKPVIKHALTHEQNYCHVDRLILGSHTGTHIDAPYHFIENGIRIDEIPIERFFGDGLLLDVSQKSAREPITSTDIESYSSQVNKGDFVIFKTGWDRYFNTPEYHEHPYLNADCALLLKELGVSLVGIDALSPDPSWQDSQSLDPTGKTDEQNGEYGYPAHDILLGNDILIVENLCNLGRIRQKKGIFSFLPLKLKESDGSPIRAIFLSTQQVTRSHAAFSQTR
jgi:kynurenine formamidase